MTATIDHVKSIVCHYEFSSTVSLRCREGEMHFLTQIKLMRQEETHSPTASFNPALIFILLPTQCKVVYVSPHFSDKVVLPYGVQAQLLQYV
ncbi:hypothetical protein AQUCO_01600410v1 [Aquilegia coerulea]|uniref:Uncharacterized protein n=1 Tax=Aquilegia coerulea TaxID=218851 RepID=A0A2G5DRQ9_AQUCA|nr:hypothetical protein AQUCO_01600410v1 [Aquilegia coerulea]